MLVLASRHDGDGGDVRRDDRDLDWQARPEQMRLRTERQLCLLSSSIVDVDVSKRV